jgi:hypothetical protein
MRKGGESEIKPLFLVLFAQWKPIAGRQIFGCFSGFLEPLETRHRIKQ